MVPKYAAELILQTKEEGLRHSDRVHGNWLYSETGDWFEGPLELRKNSRVPQGKYSMDSVSYWLPYYLLLKGFTTG